MGKVTNGGNMREAPGGSVIGQVCPGDTITYLHRQGEWITIRIEQVVADCVPDRVKAGNIGWVHQSIVTTPQVNVPTTTPAPTPEVQELNISQRIGPIYNSSRDESFSAEITLERIQWASEDAYSEARAGKVYVIAYLRMHNLGPSPMRSVGINSFEVLDANGALNDDYELLTGITDDCVLDIVDLLPGGTTAGCIAFEVPTTGKLSLIYAPYQYEGLQPGRYMAFNLRP